MSKKAPRQVLGGKSQLKKKPSFDYASNDVPKFLYDGIPTSLLSSDLSSSLHESLKTETSGSPYPIIRESRRSSAAQIREAKPTSPNLKLDTSIGSHVTVTTPSKVVSNRSMDISNGSPHSIHASTPKNKPPVYRGPKSSTTPSKKPLNDEISKLSASPVIGDQHRSFDTSEFHSLRTSVSDPRDTSHTGSDSFSYERTTNISLQNSVFLPVQDKDFQFHPTTRDHTLEKKSSADRIDSFDFPSPKILSDISHSRKKSANDSFSSQHIATESPHSHSDSVTSQNSHGSRALSRSKLVTPHSRQSSLSWTVNSPEDWTMERVIYWLNIYGFNKSWIDLFTEQGLSGAKFLALSNYKNISKYSENLDFSQDSTPSRFIHLLRKTLDRPMSDNTVKAVDQLSPIGGHGLDLLEEGRNHSNQSVVSFSDVASVTPSPISQDVHANSHLTDSSSALPELLPTVSAPNFSSNLHMKPSLAKNSFESFSASSQRLPKKNLQSRPFSTIEHSSSYVPPSSPASFSQGFFKRHTKSNSSESSIFSSLFTGTGSSNYTSDLDTKKSYKLESPISEGKKGLIKKLRNKVSDRVKPNETKSRSQASRQNQSPVHSVPSPIDHQFKKSQEKKTSKSIEEPKSATTTSTTASSNDLDNLSMLRFVLDRKYQPKSNKANSDFFILITENNETFRPVNIGSITSLADFKKKVMTEFKYSKPESIAFYLTDFGSDEGEQLTDEILEKLRSFSFYGGKSKLLVKNTDPDKDDTISNDLSLSASSTRSSIAHSTEANETNRYPATPQYLLGITTQKDPVDYLNFKDSYAQSRRKSSLIGGRPLLPVNSVTSEDKADVSSIGSYSGSFASSTKLNVKPINDALDNNTFRVIRKESVGEIDFDKRRESPFQRSQLVAKRNPPPPPSNTSTDNLSRSSSSFSSSRLLRKRQDGIPGLTPLLPLKHASDGLKPEVDKNYLAPFTPGLSTTLVPQPYRGSISPVSRTPVSPVDKGFEKEEDSLEENKRPKRSPMRRDDSVRSFLTIPDRDKFKENYISFEGAPSLSDDDTEDSDSDDGLWAKPPVAKSTVESGDTSSPESKDEELSSGDGLRSASKMVVRPPAEVVYNNLERFFPNTDLDKPIVDDAPSPTMSPVNEVSPIPQKSLESLRGPEKRLNSISRKVSSAEDDHLKVPQKGNITGRHQRMKTIRVVAHEANEARKRLSEKANANKQPSLLRRTSTKMWGQKVVEVTPSQLKGGYVSKLKNHNGEYKQFAWVKGELIGKGTFGKVYLALNVTTGEMMAVKQVKVSRSGLASKQVTEVIDALLSEVETMKDLDHVNIVQYLGFEKVGNIYSLFLEYVAGGSVGSCLRMYGRFEEDLIRYLTAQVLRGLSYLHSRGILHRDLKADNLLLEIDGSCKISDFGISKRSQNIYANDAEMSMQGTIFWMAPEVIDNVVHNKKQGYSAKIDIWSLGCVVLEMFAGRRPWSNVEAIGAIYKLGKTKLAPPIPEDTLPFVSQEGKDFIEKCFIIDPELRPTAEELLNHPFCSVRPQFEFKLTKLAQLIKFNEKRTKGEILRLDAKDSAKANNKETRPRGATT